MPKACFQHDDAAIGLSWLTPQGRGPFAPPVRRKSLQTREVCGGPLLPAAQKSSRQCPSIYEFTA
jgi:hypothetical protein